MPTDAQRLAALPLVDDTALELDAERGTARLPAGRSIDLGGIAKGYIADRVAELCEGRCLGAALNLGGNTYVLGQKPNGTAWSIGIQDPNASTGTPLLVVTLEHGSVVTSGVYERYFMKDGKRYHHILDPKTGSSAETDLLSATIIDESSMTADGFCTAVMVLGSEEGLALMEEQGLDGLLLLTDGSWMTTEGFEEKYALRTYR